MAGNVTSFVVFVCTHLRNMSWSVYLAALSIRCDARIHAHKHTHPHTRTHASAQHVVDAHTHSRKHMHACTRMYTHTRHLHSVLDTCSETKIYTARAFWLPIKRIVWVHISQLETFPTSSLCVTSPGDGDFPCWCNSFISPL